MPNFLQVISEKNISWYKVWFWNGILKIFIFIEIPFAFFNKSFGHNSIFRYCNTYMAVAIQDDLLQMLEVRVVYEGSQIGAVGRRNWNGMESDQVRARCHQEWLQYWRTACPVSSAILSNMAGWSQHNIGDKTNYSNFNSLNHPARLTSHVNECKWSSSCWKTVETCNTWHVHTRHSVHGRALTWQLLHRKRKGIERKAKIFVKFFISKLIIIRLELMLQLLFGNFLWVSY